MVALTIGNVSSGLTRPSAVEADIIASLTIEKRI